jgi:hypothetical protein
LAAAAAKINKDDIGLGLTQLEAESSTMDFEQEQ